MTYSSKLLNKSEKHEFFMQRKRGNGFHSLLEVIPQQKSEKKKKIN